MRISENKRSTINAKSRLLFLGVVLPLARSDTKRST